MRQFIKLLFKTNFSAKYVTYISFFMSLYLLLNLYITYYNVNFILLYKPLVNNSKLHNIKYILLWSEYQFFINDLIFPNLQCRVNNCVFTDDRNFLDGDYTRFDALIFHQGGISKNEDRPQKRTNSQIYVFTTIESAYNFPACELYNDNFFNWTFTHRLDSDVVWNYFVVRNLSGNAVAPSTDVAWETNQSSISPGIKVILSHKTKAAAWLVSNCKAGSFRNEYLSRLQDHLYHFALRIDVYGGCSSNRCPNDDCEEMLSKDYYFYMAFENSFTKDYVTEKVMHGYDNYVVPIVYGGANYSRFLPPDSYINACEFHPYNLAYIMHRAMNNPTLYESYFKWTNLYKIDAYEPGYHPLCNFCEALNEVRIAPVYKDFRRWWNGQDGMKWCLPNEYWNESSYHNVDEKHLFNMY